MSLAPSAQDVADALAMTLEREDASGAPWCPPRDAAELRQWVTDRNASLGTGIRRVTRLARLMAVADGRTDYIRFLYERVRSLRGPLFRQALERAAVEGRLPKGFATLTANGVHLREAALAPQGAPQDVFEIDFVQMPRLAALLDIMHNALGFAVVADLLAPLLPKSGAPQSTADEVARALQAALNAWLSERLESQNHIQQAQRLRGFVGSRGPLVPDTVDDEVILAFWLDAAAATGSERIEGFRLYSTAAAAMLRYRGALRDAMAERFLEQALNRGLEPANDSAMSDQTEWNSQSWKPPLQALSEPPADRVKWLTAREQQVLHHYLGGPAADADSSDDDSSVAGDRGWDGGLAGDQRFDVARWLTLLRADVFGAVQGSIVARLRKRADPATAIAQAMEPLDAGAYVAAAGGYAEVRAQLHLESLAALALLMAAGASEAAILLQWLGGEEAVRAILGPLSQGPAAADDAADQEGDAQGEAEDEASADGLQARIAPRLMAAIADPNEMPEGAGRTLLLEAAAARRKVSRAGFRREDGADPRMALALRAGAAAVFAVIRELDRLAITLSAKAGGADLAADTGRFLAAFRQLYLGAEDQ